MISAGHKEFFNDMYFKKIFRNIVNNIQTLLLKYVMDSCNYISFHCNLYLKLHHHLQKKFLMDNIKTKANGNRMI